MLASVLEHPISRAVADCGTEWLARLHSGHPQLLGLAQLAPAVLGMKQPSPQPDAKSSFFTTCRGRLVANSVVWRDEAKPKGPLDVAHG